MHSDVFNSPAKRKHLYSRVKHDFLGEGLVINAVIMLKKGAIWTKLSVVNFGSNNILVDLPNTFSIVKF